MLQGCPDDPTPHLDTEQDKPCEHGWFSPGGHVLSREDFPGLYEAYSRFLNYSTTGGKMEAETQVETPVEAPAEEPVEAPAEAPAEEPDEEAPAEDDSQDDADGED